MPSNPAPPKTAAASGAESNPGPYTVGGRISPPIAIREPTAHYSFYGLSKGIEGPCILSMVVDAEGKPRNVHVVKSLEASMDRKAMAAVKKWRFKPALKDGITPVPVNVTVEVDFHLSRQ